MRHKIFVLFWITCFTLKINAQTIPQKYADAMQAYNNGFYTEAYELFSQFGKSYSVDDEFASAAYYYLAETQVKMGQMDAAIPAYHYFVNRYQSSDFRDDALYKLGTIYFNENEFPETREQLTTLITQYPESEFAGSATYFIGEAFTKEGKLTEAIKFFEDAIASKKNNKFVAQSIYSLANIYEESGSYKDAVSYYDQLLTYHKNSELAPNAQVRIGLCYFKLKDYDNAVLELSDPIIEELPDAQKEEAKYILANSYYRLREYNEAEAVFNDLLTFNPSSSLNRDIRYGLAWVHFQKQKYDDAYNIFNQLAKDKDSIAVKSLFWSGESKRYAGNESEANTIYEEFLSKYPESDLIARVKLQMGIADLTASKVTASEENLLASTESKDNFVRGKAFTILGEMKLNQNKYLTAKEYMERALEVEGIPEALINRANLGLAVSQYYLNHYDEAIKYLTELREKSNSFEADKVNFYLAECYFMKNQFNNALKYYNLVSQDDPDMLSRALYGKGYAYFNAKDYGNASYSFQDFIKRNPKSAKLVDAKLRLADSYYGLKKYNDAGRIYREIFLSGNHEANSDYAYYQYAQALYKAGNNQEAIREFQNLQEKFPDSKYVAESQYIIGWINFQKGNFNAAIDNYQILLQRYPESPVVPITINSIGNSYFNLGSYDSAIANYQRVLEGYKNTNYAYEALLGIKDSYIAAGTPDQAVNLIDNYVNENPSSTYADEIYFTKGEIYYSLANYEQAKNSYQHFISSYPSSNHIPEAYYWVGKCLRNLGQNEEALYNFNVAFTKYIDTESGVSSVLEMGKIHTELQNYDSAIKIYSTALDKIPPQSTRVPEIMYSRAETEIAKGDFNSAYQDFTYIIQYYDETVFAANSKFELGVIEFARKNYTAADQLFKDLAENRVDDIGAKAQHYYGLSLIEQNKIDEAITAFVRVQFVFQRYDEWYTKSLLKLGECYERKEDIPKAKEMYNQVVARHRNDPYGKEAQDKLRSLR